jgi:L-ribulose-5-phosphate 4-epimerase
MTADDIVLIDVVSKKVVGGKQRPSRDTLTHLYLYENFPLIGGIVHTHSTYAMAFAQAGESIPAFGVTHAGYFGGDIPCSRELTKSEMGVNYEISVGKVVVETATKAGTIPAALVKAHGPFVWGETPEKAVENAIVLEEVAKTAILTRLVNPNATTVEKHVLDRYNTNRK